MEIKAKPEEVIKILLEEIAELNREKAIFQAALAEHQSRTRKLGNNTNEK